MTRASLLAARAIAALLPALSIPLAAVAQAGPPPMVTDRPDATESSATVPAGSFQLESGYTFSRVEGATVHDLGEVLLRIGVAESLEIRLGLNSYQWVRARTLSVPGLQDSSIGIKLRLLDGGGASGFGKPRIALLAATTLPTGSSAASHDGLQPTVRLAAAWELGERLSLGSNAFYGYTNDPEADERFHQGGATVSLGYALNDRWGAYAEYFGTYTVLQDGPREHYLNGGATFAIGADFQFDARAGYGLNGLDNDYFIGFGNAVRW